MKKFYVVVFMVFLLYSGSASAVLIPPAFPFSPSIDGLDDVIDTGKGILKGIRSVSDQVQEVKDEVLNEITATVSSLIPFDLSESPLKKEDGSPVIAVAREIKESEIVDIKDPTSVSEGYKNLFLNLPENLVMNAPVEQRSKIIRLYKRKGEEFIADNQMENYLAANSLRKERLPSIQKENESMQECLVEGKEGVSAICQSASASDEELGAWANYYKIKDMQDRMLRMQEELAAIDSQYEAAKTLKTGIKPFNEDILTKGVSQNEE